MTLTIEWDVKHQINHNYFNLNNLKMNQFDLVIYCFIIINLSPMKYRCYYETNPFFVLVLV